MGLGTLFYPGMKTEPSFGTEDVLMEAADFFTDAFWATKVGKVTLEPRQRTSLLNSQMMEFRRRYGNKFGDRRAELLVTRNRRGDVMGCCGIEVDRVPQTSLSSTNIEMAPLMSNVAVGRLYRRKGIAQALVQRAEDLARKEWGYNEVYLYVEKRNIPAIRLYRKLGYRKVWEDDSATTLLPLTNGGMNSSPTTLVCMKKVLNRGILARLFTL